MDLAAVPLPPEGQLLSLYQEGQPLENFIEDFLELCHQVNWNKSTLKILERAGRPPNSPHAHGGLQIIPAPVHKVRIVDNLFSPHHGRRTALQNG